jgi:peptidoglycan/xylan/chitin deacetylase (PgdA/CDA1 family)
MEYLYPGGLAKAITFSYDDGQVYDRRLIEIFNQAGFKGTFHLNSGNLDKDGYVQKAELPTLYAEHEIACHGVTHRHPRQMNQTEWLREVAGPPDAGRTDWRYCAGHELCLW